MFLKDGVGVCKKQRAEKQEGDLSTARAGRVTGPVLVTPDWLWKLFSLELLRAQGKGTGGIFVLVV